MSAVSILRPTIKLPKLLREPGGLPLSEALAQAHKNLAAASGGYLKELAEGLSEIAALATNAGADDLSALYQRSSNLIGVASVCGRPSIDAALISLCELLDHFQTGQTWDNDALTVHVNSLRLLLQTPSFEGGPGAQAILDGLQRVSRRYGAEAGA